MLSRSITGGIVNEPIHVNESTFEEAVLKSPLPVVADFWASWCSPCRMIDPSLDRIAQEYSGRLVVAKVDIDENVDLATRFGVLRIPMLLFISAGQVIYEQIGAVPYSVVERMVEQFLTTEPVQKGIV